MKILNIHKTVSNQEIVDLLNDKLNLLFREQRQIDVTFSVEIKDDAVEIYQREIYEGFLFRIKIEGTELHITRSEHYVDDVNSLTIESILNTLFEQLADDGKVTLILEG